MQKKKELLTEEKVVNSNSDIRKINDDNKEKTN